MKVATWTCSDFFCDLTFDVRAASVTSGNVGKHLKYAFNARRYNYCWGQSVIFSIFPRLSRISLSTNRVLLFLFFFFFNFPRQISTLPWNNDCFLWNNSRAFVLEPLSVLQMLAGSESFPTGSRSSLLIGATRHNGAF